MHKAGFDTSIKRENPYVNVEAEKKRPKLLRDNASINLFAKNHIEISADDHNITNSEIAKMIAAQNELLQTILNNQKMIITHQVSCEKEIKRISNEVCYLSKCVGQMYGQFLIENPNANPIETFEEIINKKYPVTPELEKIFNGRKIPQREIKLFQNQEEFLKKVSSEKARISRQTAQEQELPTFINKFDPDKLKLSSDKEFFVMNNEKKGEDRTGHFYYEDKNKRTFNIFAIFDGHGGSLASTFCEQNLSKAFHICYRNLYKKGEDYEIANAMIIAFVLLDVTFEECREKNNLPKNPGSCGIMALVVGNKLFVANCGDSRAIVVQEELNDSLRLSYDYKASNADAQKSVLKRGGECINNRVSGSLAITRAIGDEYLRNQIGLVSIKPNTPRPRVMFEELNFEKNKCLHLLMCSDGLTDVLSTKAIAKIIYDLREENTTLDIGANLITEARKKGAFDDISVGIIDLVELYNKK